MSNNDEDQFIAFNHFFKNQLEANDNQINYSNQQQTIT